MIFSAKYVSNEPRLRCPRLKTQVRVSWRKQVSVDILDDTSARSIERNGVEQSMASTSSTFSSSMSRMGTMNVFVKQRLCHYQTTLALLGKGTPRLDLVIETIRVKKSSKFSDPEFLLHSTPLVYIGLGLLLSG